jgi:hypothetical protein
MTLKQQIIRLLLRSGFDFEYEVDCFMCFSKLNNGNRFENTSYLYDFVIQNYNKGKQINLGIEIIQYSEIKSKYLIYIL